jgi:hypothetical protein
MKDISHSSLSREQMIRFWAVAKDGDSFPLLVTGGSMIPFLFDQRSFVFLKKDSAYVPKKGDIVFFARPI